MKQDKYNWTKEFEEKFIRKSMDRQLVLLRDEVYELEEWIDNLLSNERKRIIDRITDKYGLNSLYCTTESQMVAGDIIKEIIKLEE